MSGAHAAGPWELRVNGVFLRVVHGEHKTTIADGIVSEANARLIVAAPDLLEALEGGIALFSNGIDPRLDDMIAKARAAIAKARGQ